MDLVTILLTIIQMGSAPAFPDGDASLQKMLAKKIIVTCKTVDGELGLIYIDTLHSIQNKLKFKATQPSFFNEDINLGGYFFLTQIDSTYLYTEDCDYSMLKFLRYKTKNNNLAYKVLDLIDYASKPQLFRQISWDDSITIKIVEDKNLYTTKFSSYTEYWRRRGKANYAPKYPFISPEKTSLRKNLSKSQANNVYDVLTSPIFVLSFIPLESDAVWADNISGKSVKTSLITTGGDQIEGRGIDLNNDNIPDAFWYVEVVDSPIAEWYVRLYINYQGEWYPVWYDYFKER
jgi:hypothetical protein